MEYVIQGILLIIDFSFGILRSFPFSFQILCAPSELFKVKRALELAGLFDIRSAHLAYIAKTTVHLDENDVLQNVDKFLALLEEQEDVIEIHHNLQIN